MSESFSSEHPDATIIRGLELAVGFFEEAARPMLATHMPGLAYAAAHALIDRISDPSVRALADRWRIGSMDLLTAQTPVE